eukprot:237667_1
MLLQTEEKKCDIDQLHQEQNLDTDATSMKDLEDCNLESNDSVTNPKSDDSVTNITFPKTIQIPPECNAFVIGEQDSKICTYLYSTYESQIAEFNDFTEDIIYRYMSGYRHIHDYDARLTKTAELFSEYLEWRKTSDFENALNTKEVNGVAINKCIPRWYVYGQDIYGHPILFDEGLRYHKDSDLTIYNHSHEEVADKIIAYILRLVQKMKEATNKYYGLQTKLNFGSENENKNENESANKQIGITKHVVVVDLANLGIWR